ncbi:hypothetical protein KAW50_05320 [candidate division WOR-3 bacterium]|nr:hypothetical protein [candidate division WOR-3 bacterium]
MRNILFSLFLVPLMAQGAFEAIDCEKESIFENPAKLSNSGVQTLWVNSFGILPYARISCSIKNFGLGVSNFGNELYRENEFLLGYRWREFGVLLRGMNVCIKDRGSDFTIGLDFGASFKLTPSSEFNLSLQNLNFPKISDEEVPKRVAGTVVTKLMSDFTTHIQLYKESWYPFEIRIRNEIKLSELLSFGVGVKTYPSSFSIGVLLNYKRLGVSYFVRTHQELGLTHIIGVKTGGVK